jgi:hypothetical protein
MSEDGDSIADIVFQRPRNQQLVAEIAFGPALAFAVDQTAPTGIQGATLSWFMAALIGIPILRYLVYTDRIERFDLLLDLTVRPVELFAILGVAQVFKFIGIEFLQPISGLNVIEATAVAAAVATLVYILSFEIIFQKYRFSWGTLFYVKWLSIQKQIDIQMDDAEEVAETIFHHPSQWTQIKAAFGLLKLTLIRVTFGQVAFHLLKDSIPDREDEAMDELRKYIEINRDADNLTDSKGLWFAFGVAAVIVLPLLAVIAGVISLVFATFGTIVLVLLIMRLTKHIVALSYIAFGTMDYEQFVTSNRRWFAMITVYTLAVYLVIFYPI